MRVPLEEPEDGSVVALPWTSSLSMMAFSPEGHPIKKGTVFVAFPDEQHWAYIQEMPVDQVRTFFSPASMWVKVSLYEEEYGELEWLPLPFDGEVYRGSGFPSSGRALMVFEHPTFGQTGGWVETTPGKHVHVERVYSARPTFRGRVVDEDGNPVARAAIQSCVALDPNAKYSGVDKTDGTKGRLAFGTKGHFINLTKKGALADENGYFEIDAPNGLRFAIEAFSPDGQSFGHLVVEGVGPSRVVEDLTVVVLDSSSRVPEVRSFDADGREVSGVILNLMIAGDPWGRTLPAVVTDADAVVRYPWLPEEPLTLGVRTAGCPNWTTAEGHFRLEHDGNPDSVLSIHVQPKPQAEEEGEASTPP